VLDFRPSVWLDNRRLRLFDFQLNLSPFMDTALLRGPAHDFDIGGAIATAGLEFVAFSVFFRNLQLRASVGYDLRNPKGIAQRDEIFVGTSFHY